VTRNGSRSRGAGEQLRQEPLSDVYAPPAAVEPQSAAERWTLASLCSATLRDVKRAPLASLLLLGALPTGWNDVLPGLLSVHLPQWLFEEARFPRISAWFMLQLFFDAVLRGGTTLVGLDLARGKTVELRRYLEGVRFAPSIFALLVCSIVGIGSLLNVAPLLHEQQPLPPATGRLPPAEERLFMVIGLAMFALLGLLVLAIYCLGRLALANVVLVDRVRGPLHGLKISWRLTRGAGRRLWGMLFIAAALLAPRFALGQDEWGTAALCAGVLTSPLLQLLWTHAYLAMADAAQTRVSVPGAAPLQNP
jgi:hypothetical protein